jgi:hypothetical protein
MKPIKDLISSCKPRAEEAKRLGIYPNQLSRWLGNEALVDDKGHVWIQTSKKPLRIWPETNERIDNIGVNGPTGCHYQKSEYLK